MTDILSLGKSTIRSAINTRKDKFKKNVHYIKLNHQDLISVREEGVIPVNPSATHIVFLTEEGVKLYDNVKSKRQSKVAVSRKAVTTMTEENVVQQSMVTIQGTRCYVDKNQIAWINVEDVARGLGFIENAPSGNVTIRWRTVRGYLKNFGYQPIAKSCDDLNAQDFIPENIFYRLAMKANNETAQTFQAKVADDILPTLRRTGHYGNQLLMTRQQFKEVLKKINMAEEQKILAVQKVATAEQQLAASKNKLAAIETMISDLYSSINVGLTDSQTAVKPRPLLQEECFTLGELHSLVEDRMSLSEFYEYCRTKGADLSGTFDRRRAKISQDDAATVMASLGVTLDNLNVTLQQQTLTLQQVISKLQELGFSSLNDQSLSVTALISLLKDHNLSVEEQPHRKGFSSKDSKVTKQTFYSLLSLLTKPC